MIAEIIENINSWIDEMRNDAMNVDYIFTLSEHYPIEQRKQFIITYVNKLLEVGAAPVIGDSLNVGAWIEIDFFGLNKEQIPFNVFTSWVDFKSTYKNVSSDFFGYSFWFAIPNGSHVKLIKDMTHKKKMIMKNSLDKTIAQWEKLNSTCTAANFQ